jgi:uncharacterized repeat protein (TIGR01451 family)
VTPAPIPTADLSVTKTNGGTVVSVGATSTYTVVVSNAGPDVANGAIVTDPAVAGLTKTAVTCCVLERRGVSRESDSRPNRKLVSPSDPAGWRRRDFTIAATVTAASGSVSNVATIACARPA